MMATSEWRTWCDCEGKELKSVQSSIQCFLIIIQNCTCICCALCQCTCMNGTWPRQIPLHIFTSLANKSPCILDSNPYRNLLQTFQCFYVYITYVRHIYILLSAATDDNIQSHCWKWSMSWRTSFQNISADFVLEKSGGIGDVSWSDFPTMRGTDSSSVKSSSSSRVENLSMDLYHIKTMLSGLQSLCMVMSKQFYYPPSHKRHPNPGSTHSPPPSCSPPPPHTHTHTTHSHITTTTTISKHKHT